MSISKSISFDEFNTLVKNIQKSIVDKLVREEGLDPTYVLVDVKVSKKGELLNLFATEIKSIVVTDEKPEVYRFDEPDVSGVFPCTNTNLMVIVHVSDVSYADNYLVLPEDTYTFNSYDEYLDFFFPKYKEIVNEENEPCSVQTIVNGVNCGLATILVTVLNKKKIPDIPFSCHDFTMPERYRKLPTDVRHDVDAMVCPVTVESKNVSINKLWRSVDVLIDKKELIKHVCCTNDFENEINVFLDK